MANWVDVASTFQPGHGTTVRQYDYAVTDSTRPVGKYYRLHQMDLDGTSHYSEAVSVVASIEPPTLVGGFALSQNYPNPFNPSTAIKYTVGGAGSQGSGDSRTKLVIYDLLGREVATLVNQPEAPGSYEVKFDASGLASGIYIYRLTAGSYTESKRMVLMK